MELYERNSSHTQAQTQLSGYGHEQLLVQGKNMAENFSGLVLPLMWISQSYMYMYVTGYEKRDHFAHCPNYRLKTLIHVSQEL